MPKHQGKFGILRQNPEFSAKKDALWTKVLSFCANKKYLGRNTGTVLVLCRYFVNFSNKMWPNAGMLRWFTQPAPQVCSTQMVYPVSSLDLIYSEGSPSQLGRIFPFTWFTQAVHQNYSTQMVHPEFFHRWFTQPAQQICFTQMV